MPISVNLFDLLLDSQYPLFKHIDAADSLLGRWRVRDVVGT